jgi:hypothetical protein
MFFNPRAMEATVNRFSTLSSACALAACLCVRLSPAARAQEPAPADAQPSAKSAATVTYFGSYRLRVEDFNWFATPKADGAYTFVGSLLRVGVTRSTRANDLTLELAQPTLIGIPHDATGSGAVGALGPGANYYAASHNQSASFFLKQAFVRFKDVGSEPANNIRLGRFEFADAAEVTPADPTLKYLKEMRIENRLVSPSTYTHVGRSLDGFQYERDSPHENISVVAAMPTRGGL